MRWLASAEGIVESAGADDVMQCREVKDRVIWVDIEDPTPYDFDFLKNCFGVHALTIEDLRKQNRRQKIDDYPEYAFLVLQRIDWQQGNLGFKDLEVYLSRHFIVTVHNQHEAGFDALRQRLAAAPELAEEKPAFLQFLVLDVLVEHTFGVLEELERSINLLERSILVTPSRRQLNQAYELRQTVTDLDKHLSELHEVFQHLITHSVDPKDRQLQIYYRDVFGHIQRQHEMAHGLSELAHSVMEVYMAGADNRLNATMKQLTMLAALFLPVTAISGFFGMNHQFLVEHITSVNSFWLTVGLMAFTQVALALFFWRRGYF